MPKVQIKVGSTQIHVDWKAVIGAVALVCTFVVQQVPQFIGLPSVQAQPEEVKILTLAVQVASGILLLLSEFGIKFGEQAPQNAETQLNARPPAPEPPQPLVANPEGK